MQGQVVSQQVVSHKEFTLPARPGTKKMFDADRGSLFATQPETVGGSAVSHNADLGAAWLCLAAAPTFAIMALLAAVPGGMPDMLCSAAQDASPLSGMVPMYLLMSAFHSGPWLKLAASRRSGG